MRSNVGRLYVATSAVLAFFLAWAVISAHPWASAAKVDPRVAALQAREHDVRVEVARAQAAVTRKWAGYNANLRRRRAEIDRANKKRAAEYARVMAIAQSRRRVVVRSVVGGYSGRGGSSGGGSSRGGSSGGGSAGGGGGGSAPPIVSVGGGAPVSSSGSS